MNHSFYSNNNNTLSFNKVTERPSIIKKNSSPSPKRFETIDLLPKVCTKVKH